MGNPITPEERIDLQRIWDALLRLALSRGVPFQDAEDLVSAALRSALAHHDGSRGELLTFCKTILYNAIKNYWRDRKADLPFEDEQWPNPDGGPDLVLEEKERIESMKRTIERLSTMLSEIELVFMKALGQVVDELGDRAVSETARRLGLKPAKGWDLFRRIQRKAQSLETPIEIPASARIARKQRPAPAPRKAQDIKRASLDHVAESKEAARSEISRLRVGEGFSPLFSIAVAMAREEGFERFIVNIGYPISDT